MSLTRRSFFKGGVISAFLIGIPKGVLALTQVQSRTVRPSVRHLPKRVADGSVDGLSMDSFAPYTDASFIARDGGGRSITMVLKEVVDLRDPVRDRAAIAEGKEAFTLGFSSASTRFGQGTYEFSGPMGNFEMFIVPMTGVGYEAVFNRLQGE